MAKRKYVYFCETYRFGYTWQAIGTTEEEAREAIIKEYVKNYIEINGFDPRDEDCDNDDYEVFLDELYVDKREFGVVEWT